MWKEGGQHLEYISCPYMTCMCGFEHVNWSGKIEFSQRKVSEISGNFMLLYLWEPCLCLLTQPLNSVYTLLNNIMCA